jgi:GT2 family glycosyltransferase
MTGVEKNVIINWKNPETEKEQGRKRMDLSIIIVNYNCTRLTVNCLRSIYETARNVKLEVVVVDNGSFIGEDSFCIVREFPQARLIRNLSNVGFAKANNQGLTFCGGRYIMMLNPDTIVLTDALELLVAYMDGHPEADIAGPKLLNEDFTFQPQCRRGFPKLINSLAYYTGLNQIFRRNRALNSYLLSYLPEDEIAPVDAVSGSAMIVRRERVEAAGGLLDEAYFMHFEDIDLCYRVKQKGGQVWYVPDAEIVHLKGRSSWTREKGVRRNFLESAMIYFKRNYRPENPAGCLALIIGLKLIKWGMAKRGMLE